MLPKPFWPLLFCFVFGFLLAARIDLVGWPTLF